MSTFYFYLYKFEDKSTLVEAAGEWVNFFINFFIDGILASDQDDS